ncbi:LOW QUALITY PROTEIN: brevican core protein [Pseudonaja textilis]|uniref:LOW QUALITY PROTEIN: brevican core protein n=1 Tax=Pseudonaja textilis TaxID=8673 RepID=UPI000EA9F864|nr:LOW QUALITY PROTEIN: brevican core protein [Pseudonaja textilis]
MITSRYPIHTPREACYGDMNGFPGIRNYGIVDPGDMYDVYCYAEELYGDLFVESSPGKFTWEEAQAACEKLGLEMATTGQLYAAWNQGLDHCNPGWLADGSVRYPIVTPREKCGGNMPGVKTLFAFRNQTGFPDPQSKFDVFCFRGQTSPSREPPLPEAERSSQEITTVTQEMEELQLLEGEPEGAKESRGAIYSVPLFQDPLGVPEEPSEASEEAATAEPVEAGPGGCDGRSGEEGEEGGGSCARQHGPVREMVEARAEEVPSTQEAQPLDQGPQREEGEPEIVEAAPQEGEPADGEAVGIQPREEKEAHTVHSPVEPSPSEAAAGFSDSPGSGVHGGPSVPPSEAASERSHGASHTSSPPTEAGAGTSPAGRVESSPVSGPPREAGAEPPGMAAFPGTPWVPLLLPSLSTTPAGSSEESGDHSGASWPPPAGVSGPPDEGEAASEASAGFGGEPEPTKEELRAEASEEEQQEPALRTAVPAVDEEGPPGPQEALPTGGSLGLDFFSTPFLEVSLTTTHSRPVPPTERASLGASGSVSDTCMPNPCRNGGTCTEERGRPGCLCLPGYGGDACDVSLRKCQPGWDAFQGFCYKHFSARRSWEDAETRCREHGGHLANILSPEEHSFLSSQYREYQWIGLNDRTIEGDFQWSDGSPLLYENWQDGQPDSHFLYGENCVGLSGQKDGKWSDLPCGYHLPFTCKMGLISCSSPPKVADAQIFGRPKQRYEVNSVLRYWCPEGFVQHRWPLIRCQENGQWQRPQFACSPPES